MIDFAEFRQFACSLPETIEELPQLGITYFRVRKKFFATINPSQRRATLKLSPENQNVFVAISQGAMYRVPNRWGHYGWTNLDLEKASWELCQDALQTAWCDVAPKTLLAKHPGLSGLEGEA